MVSTTFSKISVDTSNHLQFSLMYRICSTQQQQVFFISLNLHVIIFINKSCVLCFNSSTVRSCTFFLHLFSFCHRLVLLKSSWYIFWGLVFFKKDFKTFARTNKTNRVRWRFLYLKFSLVYVAVVVVMLKLESLRQLTGWAMNVRDFSYLLY